MKCVKCNKEFELDIAKALDEEGQPPAAFRF